RFVSKHFSSLNNLGLVASANRINLIIIRDFLMAMEKRLNGDPCPFVIHVAGQVKDMVAHLPLEESAVFYLPWVRMLGFVPDIVGFYESLDLVVSPVTMGTGINVKTVQAMAFGMPLLATAWGVKGIETGDPLHLHQNLDELVSSIFMLKDNPEKLEQLAALSRRRFGLFYEQSLDSIRQLFAHPKLKA
ncbi:MAG: glycosyltransferase, partial [Candidatus Methylumidiphilus sp.]